MKLQMLLMLLLVFNCNDRFNSAVALTASTQRMVTTEVFLNARNQISKGITKLALDIDWILERSQIEIKDSTLFSPANLMTTLATLMLASGGQTFDEFVRIIRQGSGVDVSLHSEVYHQLLGQILTEIEEMSKLNPEVPKTTFALGIFHQKEVPVREEFRDASEKFYKSDIVAVDFSRLEAQKIIINWVNNRTEGLIKQIISDPLSPDSEAVITSALYFNGNWDVPFAGDTTTRRPFTVNNKQKIYVDMMFIGRKSFPFFEDHELGTKIIALPYKGRDVSMYVMLPRENGTEAVKNLKSKLSPEVIESLIGNMKNTSCSVLFPKMKLSNELHLRDAVDALGLKSLFNPLKADFRVLSAGHNGKKPRSPAPIRSDRITFPDDFDAMYNSGRSKRQTQPLNIESFGIDKLRNTPGLHNPGIYFDNIIHKVEMAVNERGTEAAAASMVVQYYIFEKSKQFYATKPFLFFIRHDPTKTILFWGTINRPTPFYDSL